MQVVVARKAICDFPKNILWLVLLSGWLLPVSGSALDITRAMLRGEDFQTSIFGGRSQGYAFPKTQRWDPKRAPGFALGYAEFAVHDYELTPAMIYTVNFGLANLVRSHQTVFQRNVKRDFRVRFRIFGKYEDYEEYSLKKYRKEISPNLLGFFSPATKEIVTGGRNPA